MSFAATTWLDFWQEYAERVDTWPWDDDTWTGAAEYADNAMRHLEPNVYRMTEPGAVIHYTPHAAGLLMHDLYQEYARKEHGW